VAVDGSGVVERVIENPDRLDVLIRGQVLVAEHQDLVGQELLAQCFGGLVNEYE